MNGADKSMWAWNGPPLMLTPEGELVEAQSPHRIFVDAAVQARRQAMWAQKRVGIELRAAHARGATVSELASALGISRTAVYKQLGRKEKT